jgi:uncharacterized protein with HEPN domain
VKDDRPYLIQILERLDRIEKYTQGGREAFLASTLIQDAVLYNLQTLAESTNRLSATLRDAHPEVNWRGIAGFRNILVHGYLGVDVEQVWLIVERELAALRRHIEAMVGRPDGKPGPP